MVDEAKPRPNSGEVLWSWKLLDGVNNPRRWFDTICCEEKSRELQFHPAKDKFLVVEYDTIDMTMVDVFHDVPKHLFYRALPQTAVVHLPDFVNEILSDLIEMVRVDVARSMESLRASEVAKSAPLDDEGEEIFELRIEKDTVVTIPSIKT